MYNIMAAGKPIVAIGDEDSELGFIIHEERFGWIAPPGKVSAFVDAVLEAESNSDRLAVRGKRARLLVEEEYSRERVVGLYKKLFDSMNKERKG
jgi:glycosyltransferase involved in cell wall biosynthesis